MQKLHLKSNAHTHTHMYVCMYSYIYGTACELIISHAHMLFRSGHQVKPQFSNAIPNFAADAQQQTQQNLDGCAFPQQPRLCGFPYCVSMGQCGFPYCVSTHGYL